MGYVAVLPEVHINLAKECYVVFVYALLLREKPLIIMCTLLPPFLYRASPLGLLLPSGR